MANAYKARKININLQYCYRKKKGKRTISISVWMSSLHKSGLREKKGEVGFVSAPGRRRIPNERHHTDSCIVHFLATETSRDRFVSLSLQKEHSFLTKSSERTPNKPEGLRSRRRFLIFVLQIQIYGLCLSITLKKNKTKQNNNNKKKTKRMRWSASLL